MMLGRVDQGFVDISATALNAAISGSIFADPDACFVMMMALPFGSTRAFADGPCHQALTAVTQSSVSQLAFGRLDRAGQLPTL